MQTQANQTQPNNRSLGELFSELTQEMTTLVRQEVALAKTEMADKVAKMRRDLILMAVGGLLALAGFMTLIATVIIALALVMPLWLAALIVTVIVLGLGLALLIYARDNLMQINMVPKQTVQTVKEDVQWAKEQ